MGATASTASTEMANVYIFNKISNNNKDVELLRETFTSLDCIVTVVQNQKYNELNKLVKSIVRADFMAFNYIVFIILDNENEEQGLWMTTDNKTFFLNGDLMTAVTANHTLLNKLRLSIIQTNRVFTDKSPVCRSIPKQKSYIGKDVKFYATSTGCSLQHNWDDDLPSPFIRILCEEIERNRTSEQAVPIDVLLNRISKRVTLEIPSEFPAKEINFDEPYVLGNAKIQP